jgi:hypothetical protein
MREQKRIDQDVGDFVTHTRKLLRVIADTSDLFRSLPEEVLLEFSGLNRQGGGKLIGAMELCPVTRVTKGQDAHNEIL